MESRSISDLIQNPPALPVVAGLARIRATAGNLVISAPPGSGKTTLVPPVIADLVDGKVVVVQPRRVAARAAARRISSLLGERPGNQIGFRVRGETQAGSRIEFITPGVLLRMLQHDQELAGVGAVIIDEIHERDLDTDLATAFLLDVYDTLRPDLRIVAMSATVATERTAKLIGGTVVEVPGDIHPVVTVERIGPRALGALANGSVVVQRDYLDHVSGVVREAASAHYGSVLVFLPGAREINEVAARLGGSTLPVFPLHGQLPAADQDRVLSGGSDRIILATSIAESSLTVPGVRVVVDSCLSREPRFDPSTGIGGLVTVHSDRASMTQRAGRSGREGPGTTYRCLSFNRAREYREPEIRIADLTDAMAQSAAWGAPGMRGLQLLDEPTEVAREAAERRLRSLGAIDDDGTITDLGRDMVQIPVDSRFARALIDGSAIVGARVAAAVVAMLSLNLRVADADLTSELRRLRRGHEGQSREWRRESDRLQRLVQRLAEGAGDGSTARTGAGTPPVGTDQAQGLDDAVATVVGLANPEWIARKRGRGYLLVNGAGATLPDRSPLHGEEWLAVADLSRAQGRADALIYSAVPIAAQDAQLVAAHLLDERVDVRVTGGKVSGRKVRTLGAIELGSARLTKLDPGTVIAARTAELRRTGLESLPWSESAIRLRERLAFLHGATGEPWPQMDDESLLERSDEWIGPELSSHRPDVTTALRRLLPWPAAAQFDELAPERIATPLGSAKVDYSSGRPVVRLKLQECFGWSQTPRLAGVPVTLELLSPAQRPLAVTDDLASFWAGPYLQVRAEMRGRYPKHPWPENPMEAQPTRRTKSRA